jgi:hypothetical protein
MPLFIFGLPRTGTTVLYNLLAQDPKHRVPLGWEVNERLASYADRFDLRS